MGYGGMLIPLVSTLVAITLLPVVLAKLGSRLDWPHLRTDDKASRAWTRWAELVVAPPLGRGRRAASRSSSRWRSPPRGLQLGVPSADTIAESGDAKTGLVALERSGIGEGALLPHEILVDRRDRPGEAWPPRLRGVDGIHGAVAPAGAAWRRGGTAVVDAVPVSDGGIDAGGATLERRARRRPRGRARRARRRHRRPATPTSSTPSTAASR